MDRNNFHDVYEAFMPLHDYTVTYKVEHKLSNYNQAIEEVALQVTEAPCWSDTGPSGCSEPFEADFVDLQIQKLATMRFAGEEDRLNYLINSTRDYCICAEQH